MEKVNNRKKKAVVVGFVLILAVIGVVCYFLFRKDRVTMPDVHGMSYEEAVSTIRAELRKIGIRNAEYYEGWIDDSRYPFQVASQSPNAGATIHRGEKVSVYLYIGEAWDKSESWIAANAPGGSESDENEDDLIWFIVLGVLFVLLSAVFIALGWQIWKKQKMNLIISYHCDKVSDENKQAYCTLAGIGVFIIGIGFALAGICSVVLRTASTFVPMAIGLVLGIALLVCAGIKYNH